MIRKAKGNMFEWIDYTFNPIKGRCIHNCSYCYMKKFPQKKIRFCKEELQKPLPENKFIFLVSGADMFAENAKPEWIKNILIFLNKYDNIYLFQTKNPKRYHEFDKFPKNSFFGTTIETNKQELIKSNTPTVEERKNELKKIKGNKTITFEPIMDFDIEEIIKYIKETNPKYISIGADTGKNNLVEPNKEKVLDFIKKAKQLTEVKLKHNLNRILR